MRVLFIILSTLLFFNSILSQKVDYSQDCLNDFIKDKNLTEDSRFLSLVTSIDLSKEFMYMSNIGSISDDYGIFGLNNDRIDIAFISVKKSNENPLIYEVIGKSRLKKNICDFTGHISIKYAKKYPSYRCDETWTGGDHFTDTSFTGRIVADYEFKENKNQGGSGCFKGIFSAEIRIYPNYLKHSHLLIAELFSYGAGYGASFVGIWQNYKNLRIKKCIWTMGDEDFPFAGDFYLPMTKAEIEEHKKHQGCKCDIPYRKVKINPKYINNGWVDYWKDYEKWWEEDNK